MALSRILFRTRDAMTTRKGPQSKMWTEAKTILYAYETENLKLARDHRTCGAKKSLRLRDRPRGALFR